MKISEVAIILPAYNEEKTLEALLQELCNMSYQTIVVDDGSSDTTTQIAHRHATYTLQHKVNLGKGAAMKTGAHFAFHHLGKDAVIFLDADGQHAIAELHQFQQALADGHDLVFGVRQLSQDMPRARVIGNRLLSHVTKLTFGKYVPDILSGYKAISKRAFPKVQWKANGYEVELEITVRALQKQLNIHAVPISTRYFDLERGMSFLDSLKLMAKLFFLRLEKSVY